MEHQSAVTNSILDMEASDAADRLAVMIRQERGAYRCNDYFDKHSMLYDVECSDHASHVTEADRFKIVDWCYDVIDHCNFSRETVAIAVELLDRFLSSSSIHAHDTLCDRKKYQLMAMATLYLAIKVHERTAFDSKFFSAMSRGVYSPDEIEEAERIVLRALNWRLCAPTSLQIAQHIIALLSKISNVDHAILIDLIDDVRFETEHAVRDYFFVLQMPSTVAISSVISAIDNIRGPDRDVLHEAALIIVDEMDFTSLEDISSTRNRLLRNMEEELTDDVAADLVSDIHDASSCSSVEQPKTKNKVRAVNSPRTANVSLNDIL